MQGSERIPRIRSGEFCPERLAFRREFSTPLCVKAVAGLTGHGAESSVLKDSSLSGDSLTARWVRSQQRAGSLGNFKGAL